MEYSILVKIPIWGPLPELNQNGGWGMIYIFGVFEIGQFGKRCFSQRALSVVVTFDLHKSPWRQL